MSLARPLAAEPVSTSLSSRVSMSLSSSFDYRHRYCSPIKINLRFVDDKDSLPPPAGVIEILGRHVQPVFGAVVVYFIHLGVVDVSDPGGEFVLVEFRLG